MKKWIFAFLFLSTFCFAGQGNDLAQLQVGTWKHQDKNYLVVKMINENLWHTYWKNPGDSGLANNFKFTIDEKEISLEEIPWPTPDRFIESDILWTNGYKHANTFFFQLPATISGKEFKLEVTYLICKDICIPGQKFVTAQISNNKIQLSQEIDDIESSWNQLPHEKALPENFKIYFNKMPGNSDIVVHYTYADFPRSLITSDKNILFPHKTKALIFKHEELYYDIQNKTLHGRIEAEWAGAYEEPELNFPIDGIFRNPLDFTFLLKTADGYQTTKLTISHVSLSGEKAMNSFYSTLQKIGSNDEPEPTTHTEKNTQLIFMILFAFLGGIILNFMPCVLPIISLKLFGLIKHSNYTPKQILKHNLAYTFGIIASFLFLSATIIFLKNGGEKIGWGFQLQSPTFLLGMIIILFIFALNLFGLYEFRIPGARFFGNVATKETFTGDVTSGILAVILSTPCSAPFLGTALTFAFTTTTFFTFVTFISIGIGMASPFILTAFFPKTLRLLPKPGPWMEYLKYFMGLSLILTVIWLLEVLMTVIGSSQLTYLLFILSIIFFAFFILRKGAKLKIFAYFMLLGSLVCLGHFQMLLRVAKNDVKTELHSNWKNFSPALVEEIKMSHKTAFIDFTALWCITCQVNKKLILQTDDFLRFCQENNIELIRADWTNQNDEISSFLQSYQIFGIPAYFLIKDGKVKFLGETISIGRLKENL